MVTPSRPPETVGPGPVVNYELDRDAIIAREPIPEASPALGGLRRALLEVRIRSKQHRIEDLAGEQGVLEFVLGRIQVGKPYSNSASVREHKPVPESNKALRATRKLEKLESRRRRLVGLRHDLAMPLDPKRIVKRDGDEERFPSMLTLPKVGSPIRLSSIEGAKNRDRKHKRRIKKIDKRMNKIVQRPVNKFQKAIEQRDILVRKHEAITRARAAAAAKRSTS